MQLALKFYQNLKERTMELGLQFNGGACVQSPGPEITTTKHFKARRHFKDTIRGFKTKIVKTRHIYKRTLLGQKERWKSEK